MRKLIIKHLRLINFKGIRQASATFGRTATTVSGDNGTGKSTIADAFAWLLFGKNAAGSADTQFGIKTVDADGHPIPDLDHEVEGAFSLIDTATGAVEDFTLRRSYKEEWRTRQGETERYLGGHHTDYFWNDIPVKKSEYEARIAAVIPSEAFRLLTDPAAFLSLNWEAMRAKLTEIAGDVNPADIAEGIQRWNDLLCEMNGATLEEYRTVLGAQRKRVDAELQKIPTRKDELTRAPPATPDYAALELRKQVLESAIADIDAANSNIAERRRVQYEQAAKVQERINAQEAAKRQAKHEADMAAADARNAALRRRSEAESAIRLKEAEMQQHINGANAARRALHDVADLRTRAEALGAELVELRSQFQGIYNSCYTPGSLICPRFGHECTDPTACGKGEEEFNAAQVRSLTDMRTRGQQLNERIAAMEAEAADREATANAALNTAETRRLELESQIAQARAALPSIPATVVIDYTALPTYREAEARIAELKKQIDDIMATPGGGTPTGYVHTDAKRHAQMELDEVKRKLGLKEVIEAHERRQRELDEQTRKLAAEKAAIERKLAELEEFNVAIMNAAEERVNAHFDMVKFRMFRTLVNGNREPACIPTVRGVNIRDVNTAAQINAGLDIIQTLTRHHRFTAPIFIDNCESVATLRKPCDSQTIRLEFVKGQPLTVTPEE